MSFKGLSKKTPTARAGYQAKAAAKSREQALTIAARSVGRGYDVKIHDETGRGGRYPYTIYTKKQRPKGLLGLCYR